MASRLLFDHPFKHVVLDETKVFNSNTVLLSFVLKMGLQLFLRKGLSALICKSDGPQVADHCLRVTNYLKFQRYYSVK